MIEHGLDNDGLSGIRAAEGTFPSIERDLEGLDEATKAPLAKRLQAAKQKVADAYAGAEKRRWMTGFTQKMEAASGSTSELEAAEEAFQSDQAKRFLDAGQRETYAQQLAAARAKLTGAASDAQSAALEKAIVGGEKDLAELRGMGGRGESTMALDQQIERLTEDLNQATGALNALPEDNPRRGELAERLLMLANDFIASVVSVQAADVLKQLVGSWTAAAKVGDGSGDEIIGPNLAQVLGAPNRRIHWLNAPKTAALLAASDKWLGDNFALGYSLADSGDPLHAGEYKDFLADAKVKALADEVRKTREAAAARIAGYATAILAQAEKAKLDDAGRTRIAALVEEDLPAALAGAPQLAPLRTRGHAILAKR